MAGHFDQSGFGETYERDLVGPVFRPWAEILLEEVALAPASRVLDVACGTGIVARLASERLGGDAKVVGVDLGPSMLAVARRVAAQIDWRQGDAAALPIGDDERFDVVVCQQGLQFFADQPAALREMRRALAGGGRLALSTWRSDQELPVRLALRRIVERQLGPIVDRRHALGEAGAVEALLEKAGFREIRSKTLSRTMRFPDGAAFVRANAMVLIGMSSAANALDDEERERILSIVVRDSGELVTANTDETGFRAELRANVFTASA